MNILRRKSNIDLEGNSIVFISKWAIKIFYGHSWTQRRSYLLSFIALFCKPQLKGKKLNNWLRNRPWKSSYLSTRPLAVVVYKFFACFHQTFMKNFSYWEPAKLIWISHCVCKILLVTLLISLWMTTIVFASVKRKDFPSNFG